MKQRQRGMTTVEFALVGLLTMVFLFGVIEFGRALWVSNTLTEATRRAARLAVVCPPNHPSIRNVAVLSTPDGTRSGGAPPDLTAADVTLEYLDAAGGPLPRPGAAISNIRFVRASITNYQLTLNIPLVNATLTLPAFTTTLPAESLGLIPETGARQCFGS